MKRDSEAINSMKINLGGDARHKKLLQKVTHATNSNLKATHTFETNLKATRKESRTNLADYTPWKEPGGKQYSIKILKRPHLL